MNDTPLKPCKGCGITKPLSNFGIHKSTKDGHRNKCKTCCTADEKKRQQRPEIAARSKERNQSAANRAYMRKYRQRPEVKARKQELRNRPEQKSIERQYNHSPKAIEGRKRYTSSERGKLIMAVKTRRRRAIKRNLPADFSAKDWQTCLEYFNGCCAVCGRPLKDLFKTIRADADHWIPLTNPTCPGTVKTNIVPLCGGQDGCNNAKSNKLPNEWLMQRYGIAKAKRILKQIEDYFSWIQERPTP